MLIGDVNPNKDGVTVRHMTLQALVDTLALTHVSRYPIEVVSIDCDRLLFRDTRFRGHPVAKLFIDYTTNRITIDCDRIENNKFNQHNPDYSTRTTNDLAKMRKWLKEYVQPYSPAEVARFSFGDMKAKFAAWADHYNNTFRDSYLNISTTDVIKDIINYLGGGQPYTTGKLAQYATQEFRLQILENERRRKCESPKIHLFINPDGVMWLTGTEIGQFSECTISGAQVLDSVDMLPGTVKEKYSMLKLVDDGTYLETVGVRLHHNNFWLHE